MRRIAVLVAACASIAPLAVPSAAFASSPPGPPGGGTWDLTAVSSTGGATVYGELQPPLGLDFVVCDTKADRHHAHGIVQLQYADGSWHSLEVLDEYDGNGYCTDTVAFTMLGPLRIVAETKEGNTTIGSPGYSKVLN